MPALFSWFSLLSPSLSSTVLGSLRMEHIPNACQRFSNSPPPPPPPLSPSSPAVPERKGDPIADLLVRDVPGDGVRAREPLAGLEPAPVTESATWIPAAALTSDPETDACADSPLSPRRRVEPGSLLAWREGVGSEGAKEGREEGGANVGKERARDRVREGGWGDRERQRCCQQQGD
eukprot:763695-Hanusia_phi.AAC.4